MDGERVGAYALPESRSFAVMVGNIPRTQPQPCLDGKARDEMVRSDFIVSAGVGVRL